MSSEMSNSTKPLVSVNFSASSEPLALRVTLAFSTAARVVASMALILTWPMILRSRLMVTPLSWAAPKEISSDWASLYPCQASVLTM